MPDYTVTDSKLQELNVIVGEKGGVIPSKVSDALAAMEVATAAGNKAEAQKQFKIAVAANGMNGAAWSEVQAWHDAVKNSGGGTPPADPYIGPPVNPLPNDGVTRTFGPVSADNPGVTVAGGDGEFSFADSSGNIGYVGKVNGVVVIDGGMTPVAVKAGDQLSMSPQPQFGSRPSFTYSLNKYAG